MLQAVHQHGLWLPEMVMGCMHAVVQVQWLHTVMVLPYLCNRWYALWEPLPTLGV